uniref:Methylosome subunit pICln n=1 Tax=Jaculus jaculus TaxID=51337 RepID=A0A8C5KN42_JACJA
MSFLKSFPPPWTAKSLGQQPPNTKAVLNRKGLGTGTLYIAKSRLSWLDGSGLGFSLEYPIISKHAFSRDLNACPQLHLNVMVNAKYEEDSDNDVEPITEFRFVPSGKSALGAVCECQALHPHGEDSDSDDCDKDVPTFYTYEAELSHFMAEGQATLERLEGMFSLSVSSQYHMAGVWTEDSVGTTPAVAGQFEDADVDH